MKKRLKYCLLFFFSYFISAKLFAQHLPKEIHQNHFSYTSIITFFLGVIAGIVCMYLYSRRKIYFILREEKAKYISSLKDKGNPYFFNYVGLVSELKESKDSKKKQIEDSDDNLDQHKSMETNKKVKPISKIYETVKGVALLEESRSTPIELKIEQPPQKAIEQPAQKEIETYFTIPEKDGSFRIENGKNKKDDNCYFKILPENEKQKATLHFIPGDFDLRALDNIDYYLNPVCEIENITNRTKAQKIKMISPGIVNLNGENWQIDLNNKVKIRLI